MTQKDPSCLVEGLLIIPFLWLVSASFMEKQIPWMGHPGLSSLPLSVDCVLLLLPYHLSQHCSGVQTDQDGLNLCPIHLCNWAFPCHLILSHVSKPRRLIHSGSIYESFVSRAQEPAGISDLWRSHALPVTILKTCPPVFHRGWTDSIDERAARSCLHLPWYPNLFTFWPVFWI